MKNIRNLIEHLKNNPAKIKRLKDILILVIGPVVSLCTFFWVINSRPSDCSVGGFDPDCVSKIVIGLWPIAIVSCIAYWRIAMTSFENNNKYTVITYIALALIFLTIILLFKGFAIYDTIHDVIKGLAKGV